MKKSCRAAKEQLCMNVQFDARYAVGTSVALSLTSASCFEASPLVEQKQLSLQNVSEAQPKSCGFSCEKQQISLCLTRNDDPWLFFYFSTKSFVFYFKKIIF